MIQSIRSFAALALLAIGVPMYLAALMIAPIWVIWRVIW